jgi:hypothetical protein
MSEKSTTKGKTEFETTKVTDEETQKTEDTKSEDQKSEAPKKEVEGDEAPKQTKEERIAGVVHDAQNKGVTPPNIKEYAKAIQTADVPQTEGAAKKTDKPEDGSLVNEKQPEGQPLTDEHGNPLPELPPLKTEEAK